VTGKLLGKITVAEFGRGGYDDAMTGFSFILEGEGFATGDFWGTWSHWSPGCKWTVEEQKGIFGDASQRVSDLLRAAKKKYLRQLVGVPVEVFFENNRLSSWRILTEVL
jgi:hypothetical protein